jgi:hemerythrin superfamily protein
LKLVEIEVSNDKTIWESLGSYTLLSTADKQFIELTETAYFRVIVRSDYKNSNFTALAEVGVYKR